MHHSNHTHSIVPERLFGDDITNTTYPSEGRPLPPCFQRTQVTKKQRLDEQVLHQIYFCSSFLSSDSGTSSNFGNTKATHDHPKPDLEATFFTNLSDLSKPVSCSNLVLAKIPCDIFDKLYESAAGSFEQCPIAVATSKQGSKRLSALITQLSNTKHVAELKRDSRGRVPFIVPDSDEREIEVGEGEIKTRATLFICSIEVIVRAVKMEATQRAQKRADDELKMSYITALHEQNSAASKIQSVIRMIKFKREFPRMKEEFIAARTIQSCMRVFLFRRLMGTLSRFRLAATKVQTIVRMWKSKRDVCRRVANASSPASTSALKPTSVQSAATIIPAASFKQEVDTHNGSNDAFTLICRSKDDSKKKFGDLLRQTQKIYYLHGKGPSTDIEQEQWKVITSVLKNWYEHGLSRLLEKCSRFEVFESEDGAATIRFKTLLMTTKSGPGVYCSEVEQDGQVLEYRIGMSDGECYDRVKRDNNNPLQSSKMCMPTEEFTKIMQGCNEYEKAVKTVYENCLYFNYETSRSDRREKGVANQLAELLMKALLLKSEDRELTLSRRVNPGIAAERIFALGSKFVRDVCQFSNSSEHEDAVDRLSMADEFTWLLTWTPYSSLLDEDIDRLLESSDDDDALQQVIQQVYRGRPTHKFMQKHLMLRLFGEDNSISWRNAVHRSHVHDAVHQVAESMKEIIRNEDIDTVSKKNALVEAIQTINNSSKFKRDYQPPLSSELGKGGFEELSLFVDEAKKSSKNRIIAVEKCLLRDMEKYNPKKFASMIAPPSESLKIKGHLGEQAEVRTVLHTNEQVALLVTHSVHTIFGVDKEEEKEKTPRSDVARINGIIKMITLLGILADAGQIKREYADRERKRLMSTLIIWEGYLGDFGKNIAIQNLHQGIHSSTQKGFNTGVYVKPGVRYMSNKISQNVGLNDYYIIQLMTSLGLDDFCDIFNLVTGVAIDKQDIRKTMDKLKRTQGKLGRWEHSEATKAQISAINTGRRFTDEHIQAISISLRKVDTSKYQDVLAARRRQFDNLSLSQKRLEGIVWQSRDASWELQLPSSIFGKQIYIRRFTHHSDAKAAQKYLLKALKGLRARKPSSTHFDINNRSNKTILDEAIKQVRLSYAKGTSKIRDINIL
ncbi:hypothetical protein QTG54_001387 [Skeletonema marinoi]|uniref:Calmodulin n=1 Tax=Skeletonema marinoi TaxID=267567 RepID=A0AAD8YKX6_9STRA|nr:hypothetical protein QTG54_001387 [Skeletonema marinoi]